MSLCYIYICVWFHNYGHTQSYRSDWTSVWQVCAILLCRKVKSYNNHPVHDSAASRSIVSSRCRLSSTSSSSSSWRTTTWVTASAHSCWTRRPRGWRPAGSWRTARAGMSCTYGNRLYFDIWITNKTYLNQRGGMGGKDWRCIRDYFIWILKSLIKKMKLFYDLLFWLHGWIRVVCAKSEPCSWS